METVVQAILSYLNVSSGSFGRHFARGVEDAPFVHSAPHVWVDDVDVVVCCWCWERWRCGGMASLGPGATLQSMPSWMTIRTDRQAVDC